MEPLGHVELQKMQKRLEGQNKNQTEMKNKKKIKSKIHFYFHFCFCVFGFCFFYFLFLNFTTAPQVYHTAVLKTLHVAMSLG